MWIRAVATLLTIATTALAGCGDDDEPLRSPAGGLMRVALVVPSSLAKERTVRLPRCPGTRTRVVLLSAAPADRFAARLRQLTRRDDIVMALGFTAPRAIKGKATSALPADELERLMREGDRICGMARAAGLLRASGLDTVRDVGDKLEDLLPERE